MVMQYANKGSLLSYLDQNIKLTWTKKLWRLNVITEHLRTIHYMGLVCCNLHGGNIILHDNTLFICDLGLSRSVNSCKSSPTIQGVLPFIAPEVFHTRKFTRKSDVYSFGIIMYLVATGEQPFRDRQFDASLIREIMDGLRPSMPDSAPEEYKTLAKQCCDADSERPNAKTLIQVIDRLIKKIDTSKDDSIDKSWSAIYFNEHKTFLMSQEGE